MHLLLLLEVLVEKSISNRACRAINQQLLLLLLLLLLLIDLVLKIGSRLSGALAGIEAEELLQILMLVCVVDLKRQLLLLHGLGLRLMR